MIKTFDELKQAVLDIANEMENIDKYDPYYGGVVDWYLMVVYPEKLKNLFEEK